MKDVILYHAHCSDGFSAAWAAWRALGNSADYIPVQYGNPLPPIKDGSNVYILDFSYPAEILDALDQRCSLLVIDHHITAQRELQDKEYAIFDMNRSGGVLAWQWFHAGKEVPLLLSYVQDRDLWKWELPNSREVSAALWSTSTAFDAWTKFAETLNDDPGEIFSGGSYILRYMGTQVEMICSQAKHEWIAGYNVMVVNATSLWSEVGEELLRQYPQSQFVASYYDLKNGLRKWSLRSRKDFDVSAVAKLYGGGGHAQAAGFVTDLTHGRLQNV